MAKHSEETPAAAETEAALLKAMAKEKATSEKTAAVAETEAVPGQPKKKDRPTPKREDQEAARRRPLIPDRQKAKQRMREMREESRRGYERGDDRFLPPRERGRQRKFVRDYVDSRFSLGEAVIPVMFVLIIAMSFPPPVAEISVLVLWLVFIGAVIDILLMNNRLMKKIQEKFGEGSVEKGTRWYSAMRALQMRFLRLPKPQVKYGDKPY